MDLETYRRKYDADDGASPGWDAITAKLDEIYDGREPRHWGTVIKYVLGGDDPIDGVSAYLREVDGKRHEHMVTYGFSELYYDEESVGKEFSRFGFELTFRLAVDEAGEDVHWAINFLQNIARYVFKTGNYFEDSHYMPANGPIKLECDTLIHALMFVTDPELGGIDTPHGRVEFLQVVGITQKEYEAIRADHDKLHVLVDKLRARDPLLVTDLSRGEIEL